MDKNKQLFFLHFAGGNSYSYNYLLPHLSGYEVFQLELPGRGKRMREGFLNDREAAVQDYYEQLKNLMNGKPFIVFGHSMGASLGHEAVALLEDDGIRPEKLVASGNPGPKVSDSKMRHLLERDAFIEELKEMGGIPHEFFNHLDLMDFFLPALKSDFKIIETELVGDYPVIETPIVAVMGSEEEHVDKIDNWKNYTKAAVRSFVWPGNHFFIHDHALQLAEIIGLDVQ